MEAWRRGSSREMWQLRSVEGLITKMQVLGAAPYAGRTPAQGSDFLRDGGMRGASATPLNGERAGGRLASAPSSAPRGRVVCAWRKHHATERKRAEGGLRSMSVWGPCEFRRRCRGASPTGGVGHHPYTAPTHSPLHRAHTLTPHSHHTTPTPRPHHAHSAPTHSRPHHSASTHSHRITPHHACTLVPRGMRGGGGARGIMGA